MNGNPVLGHASFTPYSARPADSPPPPLSQPLTPVLVVDMTKTLAQILDPVILATEHWYLTALMRLHEGRAQPAATAAGISRRTLLRKLISHKINRRDYYKKAGT